MISALIHAIIYLFLFFLKFYYFVCIQIWDMYVYVIYIYLPMHIGQHLPLITNGRWHEERDSHSSVKQRASLSTHRQLVQLSFRHTVLLCNWLHRSSDMKEVLLDTIEQMLEIYIIQYQGVGHI